MKTYSIAIKSPQGHWLTNFGKYFNLSDINWDEVLAFCVKGKYLAYGYYYGHKSNELTSSRCRTEIANILPKDKPILYINMQTHPNNNNARSYKG